MTDFEPSAEFDMSFLSRLKKHVVFFDQQHRNALSKSYGALASRLESFLLQRQPKQFDLAFDEITSQFLEDFKAYLRALGLTDKTIVNYLNCLKKLYFQAVNVGDYHPQINPFEPFLVARYEGGRDYLEKEHLFKINDLAIKKSDPLFDTRNYFLFQIFAKGLRFSDLMLLRFSDILNGSITFKPYRAKDNCLIHIGGPLLDILIYYIHDKRISEVLDINYSYTFRGEQFIGTFAEIRLFFNQLKDSTANSKLTNHEQKDRLMAEMENFRIAVVEPIKSEIQKKFLSILMDYSIDHGNEFIFPILNARDFRDINLACEINFEPKQYQQIVSKTTVYHKMLERLQYEVNKQFGLSLDLVLDSHVPKKIYNRYRDVLMDGF